MSGIYTRPEVDKIVRNTELTEEEKTERLFSLHGRDLDAGYISKRAAEEAKQAAVEAAKADFKPEPIDPRTTPEYMEIQRERDMLRAIGGDDFQGVKPKFRETVFGMLDRGEKAPAVADQLTSIREKYEEYFVPEKAPEEPKKTPQFSQQPGRQGTNPESKEEEIYKQISASW